jgi:peptide/nickel transport system substrate-binding protein
MQKSSSKISTFATTLMILFLASCQAFPKPTVEPVNTVEVNAAKAAPTAIKESAPSATPEPNPDTLVICALEPETISPFGGLDASNFLQAIFDGPIDRRMFSAQPVILEKLPSLADGDAVKKQVVAHEGDIVADADQTPIILDAKADPPQHIRIAGQIEPVEYTGGEVTMEQLELNFKLLPGLVWDDGEPLTVHDSVFSYNLWNTVAEVQWTTNRTAHYVALDDLTVQWTGLPGFFDPIFSNYFYIPIPEHVLGEIPAKDFQDTLQSGKVLYPGYGPYKFVEWKKGEYLHLVKNPLYFRAAEGLPKFEHLYFNFQASNAETLIAMVENGDCDIAITGTLNENVGQILDLQKAGRIKANFVPGNIFEVLNFGIQPREYDDGYDPAVDRYDFFSDVRVRQAIAYCIDRQEIIDTIFFGQTVTLDTYVPPSHPLFYPNTAHYPYDPQRGRQLLHEAGWQDQDGDGVLEKDGVPFEVKLETTDAVQRRRIIQLIQSYLKGCGIQVDLNSYTSSLFFGDPPEGFILGRQFDLAEFAWIVAGPYPPCDLSMTAFIPGPAGESFVSILNGETFPIKNDWVGQNITGFTNQQFDDACRAGLNSLPGEPGYVENHHIAQQIFAENLPFLPLYMGVKVGASRPDMCGYKLDPTEWEDTWNIEEFGYGPLCDP